jgi:hypothetical protein
VAVFLAEEMVEVERMTKKGLRTFDTRQAVLGLDVTPYDGGMRLDVILRHAVPAVRPDDVVSGLTRVASLELTDPVLVTRLAQGPWDEDARTIGDPLARG